MNPLVGWALAALLTVAAWRLYGLPGIALAVSVTVFWLLLQFNRALRVMKNAAGVPVGHIDSAVMFNARLKPGLTMMQVVALTKSLGRKVSASPEVWAWVDGGGDEVVLTFSNGRVARWTLVRQAGAGQPTP